MLRLLLLLLPLLAQGQHHVGYHGYENKNLALLVGFTWNPSSFAAGVLPEYVLASIQFPLTALRFGGLAARYTVVLNFGFGGIESAIPGQMTPSDSWVPFVPFMFRYNIMARDYLAVSRYVWPYPVIYPMNVNAAILDGCHPEAWTDPNGKLLSIALVNNQNQYTDCHYNEGHEIVVYIPQHYLAPQPEWPEAIVRMNFAVVAPNWDAYLVTSAAVPFAFVVPYTVTTPEVQLSRFQFWSIVPSSTVQNVVLTSLTLQFTLGINVLAGGSIMLMVSAPIFQDVMPNAIDLPFIVVGVNCAHNRPSPFCCYATTAYTRVSNGLFGYDSSLSQRDLNLGGYSVLSMTLSPPGCHVPADRRITVVIPREYLSSNPALIDPTDFNAYNYAFRRVNAKMATSSEPTIVIVQRYTQPGGQFYTLTIESYQDTSSNGGHAWAIAHYGAEPFTTYIIGTSTVSNFIVVVDTVTAGLTPTTMKFSFELATSFVEPTDLVNGGLIQYTPQRFSITSNQGVFKYNQGTLEIQNQLTQDFFQGQCAATWFINVFGTLMVTPNPSWRTECTNLLRSGTRVEFSIPGSALLPNAAAGSIITFDIRVIPAYRFDNLFENSINIDGVTIANEVDGATLMNQFGFQTVAVCSGQPSISGRLGDIANLNAKDRCLIVQSLAILSPTSAAILPCPGGLNGGYITYVKVPEGMWTQEFWPLTNVALSGTWAQVVSANPLPVVVINAFGYMISYPMFAVVVVYPPTVQSLQSLGVNANVPAAWTVGFVVRMDRITLSCQIANDDNPWIFDAAVTCYVTEVLLFVDHLALNAAGTPLTQVPGGLWAQNGVSTTVIAPHGGAVVGFCTVLVSPVPEGSDSDDALFGLLALIAIPVLLCCCLLALLWFLRPKTEPCPCVPEYPVQEMYWVNAQPAATCAPTAAPVYFVQ